MRSTKGKDSVLHCVVRKIDCLTPLVFAQHSVVHRKRCPRGGSIDKCDAHYYASLENTSQFCRTCTVQPVDIPVRCSQWIFNYCFPRHIPRHFGNSKSSQNPAQTLITFKIIQSILTDGRILRQRMDESCYENGIGELSSKSNMSWFCRWNNSTDLNPMLTETGHPIVQSTRTRKRLTQSGARSVRIDPHQFRKSPIHGKKLTLSAKLLNFLR